MSEKDIDVLARTIWAEARGEGVAGQVAVGRCIRNRVEADLGRDGKPDWWDVLALTVAVRIGLRDT